MQRRATALETATCRWAPATCACSLLLVSLQISLMPRLADHAAEAGLCTSTFLLQTRNPQTSAAARAQGGCAPWYRLPIVALLHATGRPTRR